ncbi:MAG: rhodanese-like domain-containing protein [Polyangiales bacterium]
MNVIEREELVRLSSEVLIAEVLPASYYSSGHLPGAVHLPLEGLEKRAGELIPHKDSAVVLYCSGPTCTNSHQAAERLARIGYRDVKVFVGGKAAWKEAGLPFEVR